MNLPSFRTFVALFFMGMPGAFAQFDAYPFYVQQLRLHPEFARVDDQSDEDLHFRDTLLQFNFEWEEARGSFSIGSSDLNQKAIWFTPRVSNPDWTILEASVGYRTGFGEFRLGQMPIRMLFEDFQNSDFDFLPDSTPRRRDWFVRTDSALRYFVSKFPWQTALYGHVGESDSNLDHRYFATTYLKFQPSQGVGFVLSGFVGHTGTESTVNAPASTLGFQFDPNASSKIRAGLVDLFYVDPQFSVLLENGIGQVLQDDGNSQFQWGRADAILSTFRPWYFFGRYEMTNPNTALSTFQEQTYLAGIGYSIQKGLGKVSISGGEHQAFASFELNYLREREGDSE